MKRLLIIAVAVSCVLSALAQAADTVSAPRRFGYDVRGVAFFQDNEFPSPLMTGYSLPGFRISAAAAYRPSRWVDIQVGVYLLQYWGADAYPNQNYIGLPTFNDVNASRGFHALPYFSAQVSTPWGLEVTLGSLRGDASHGLIMPMFAPELSLTADPQAGAEVRYQSRWIDADAWIDWRSFIFRNSPTEENFYVGASAKVKYTSDDAIVQVYSPIQLMIEHVGGEIDTINSVQTYINAAVGVGARLSLSHPHLRWVGLEADMLGSFQQKGTAWRHNRGTACWVVGTLQASKMRAQLGYYRASKFSPILGYPLFGIASQDKVGVILRNPSTIYAGYEFAQQFGPGVTLSAFVDVYHLLPCDAFDPAVLAWGKQKSTTSFDFGAKISIALTR